MIVYLDTSALVKLFMDEPAASAVARLLEEARTVVTHLITYAEARAALARAMRVGRIPPAALVSYRAALEGYWERMERVVVDLVLVKRAGVLAETHGLRGYDSVHLAAAERVAGHGLALTFACFDARLSRAAKALGMATFGA